MKLGVFLGKPLAPTAQVLAEAVGSLWLFLLSLVGVGIMQGLSTWLGSSYPKAPKGVRGLLGEGFGFGD